MMHIKHMRGGAGAEWAVCLAMIERGSLCGPFNLPNHVPECKSALQPSKALRRSGRTWIARAFLQRCSISTVDMQNECECSRCCFDSDSILISVHFMLADLFVQTVSSFFQQQHHRS